MSETESRKRSLDVWPDVLMPLAVFNASSRYCDVLTFGNTKDTTIFSLDYFDIFKYNHVLMIY